MGINIKDLDAIGSWNPFFSSFVFLMRGKEVLETKIKKKRRESRIISTQHWQKITKR